MYKLLVHSTDMLKHSPSKAISTSKALSPASSATSPPSPSASPPTSPPIILIGLSSPLAIRDLTPPISTPHGIHSRHRVRIQPGKVILGRGRCRHPPLPHIPSRSTRSSPGTVSGILSVYPPVAVVDAILLNIVVATPAGTPSARLVVGIVLPVVVTVVAPLIFVISPVAYYILDIFFIIDNNNNNNTYAIYCYNN